MVPQGQVPFPLVDLSASETMESSVFSQKMDKVEGGADTPASYLLLLGDGVDQVYSSCIVHTSPAPHSPLTWM